LIFWLKKLIVGLGPVTLLVVVLVASFRMVLSETVTNEGNEPSPVPVANQSVVIEAKSASLTTSPEPLPPELPQESARQSTPQTTPQTTQALPAVQPQSFSAAGIAAANKKNEVWLEINDAISGLNELVGVEMFVDVKRGPKGQMEIMLDNTFWKRVRYQTRVDLKTDISNLWHLYVTEYGHASSSVVYFIDQTDGRVIDIFSRAN